MLAYRYYCMNSSPLAQHMPPDMVAYRVWGSRPYLPDLGGIVYGTVELKTVVDGRNEHLRPFPCERCPAAYHDTGGNLMTGKQINEMSDFAFAAWVLQERYDRMSNPNTTLAKRMRSVAAVLRTLDEAAKSETALAEMEGSNHE